MCYAVAMFFGMMGKEKDEERGKKEKEDDSNIQMCQLLLDKY